MIIGIIFFVILTILIKLVPKLVFFILFATLIGYICYWILSIMSTIGDFLGGSSK